MARRQLAEPMATMERQVIETLLAGYSSGYPSSHSDFEGCVRNLFRMFEVKRLPVAIELSFAGESNPQGPG